MRDMAVYDHYAYIVSDGIGVGLQIVDLAGIDDDNVVLVNTTDLGVGFTNAHNVFVNSDSGFLYLAKPDIGDETGLTAVDLNVDPVNPTIAGFWTSSVICHDLYVTNHPSGQEIAFCFARNAGLRIVNVTFKLLMTELSFLFYPTVQLCHQGWLTDDFGYVVFGDEKDELDDPGVISTTTYVVDVSNLLDPTLTTTFTNGLPSIDHNLMIRGDFVYEANYTSGMRMFSLCNVDNIQEVGFLDTRPEDDVLTFQGAWSVDAQLPSGTIVVSDKERGVRRERRKLRPRSVQRGQRADCGL